MNLAKCVHIIQAFVKSEVGCTAHKTLKIFLAVVNLQFSPPPWENVFFCVKNFKGHILLIHPVFYLNNLPHIFSIFRIGRGTSDNAVSVYLSRVQFRTWYPSII